VAVEFHAQGLAIGLGLVIGGALGNLIDRLVHGKVADFFHFYVHGYDWYVFNVADCAITVGVAALLYDAIAAARGRSPARTDNREVGRNKNDARDICLAPWRLWAEWRFVLVGCDSIREAAGITKEPPDEFAVVTKAPLVIPPDYNLRPPKPGAAPTNQVPRRPRAPRRRCSAKIPAQIAASK
jgi:hypothetical protein